MAVFSAALFLAAILITGMAETHGQELEPRAYSPSPVGTNFLLANYSRLSGEVLTDPSLPITDVDADIRMQAFGYVRTFSIAGHSASLGILVPISQADVSGNVFDASREVYRSGLGDVRMRFAMGLAGAPALSPEEFARRTPTASLGTSLTIVAPTGEYMPSRLINIGANRWAFKPEIGISQSFGKWFAEGSAGVWLFTDNEEFLGTRRRKQDALSVLQFHGGYNFRPGLWLAVDLGYSAGGRTEVDGVEGDDRQENSRYGLTLSMPIAQGWSAKLSWSQGFATRAGGDFEAIAITLQYRWFDR